MPVRLLIIFLPITSCLATQETLQCGVVYLRRLIVLILITEEKKTLGMQVSNRWNSARAYMSSSSVKQHSTDLCRTHSHICIATYVIPITLSFWTVAAGASTGGLLAARAGWKAAGKNAIIGGVLLGMIEGLNLAVGKMFAPPVRHVCVCVFVCGCVWMCVGGCVWVSGSVGAWTFSLCVFVFPQFIYVYFFF